MAPATVHKSANASDEDNAVDVHLSADDDEDIEVIEVVIRNNGSSDDKREQLSKWIQERRVVEEGLRLEIRQRDRRIASMTTGTKELESTQKQLREELQSLEARLRNEKSEREALEKDRDAALKETRKELEAKSTRLEADVDRLRTELEKAKEKCAHLEGNILVVRAGSVQLQEEKVELKQKLGENENEITRLMIEQSRIEREALGATATLNKEVASLKEKLKAKENEAEQLGAQLKKEEAKGNTEKLLKKIEELRDQLRKKKDDLYQAQKDLKAEREALKPPSTFQVKEERLNKLVKEKDTALNKLVNEKSKMEKDLRDQISTLHREVADLKEQLAAKQGPAPVVPSVGIVPPPPPPHGPAPQSQSTPPPQPMRVETAAIEPRKRRSDEPMHAAENHQPAEAGLTTTPSPPASGARNLKDLSSKWKKYRPDLTFANPPDENVPPVNPVPPAHNQQEASPSPTASSPGTPNANPARLLIRNLHTKITSEMLTKIFQPFGELRRVEIAMKNGESRGFAHVEYVNVNEAMTARIKLDGFRLLERKLIISEAGGNRLS